MMAQKGDAGRGRAPNRRINTRYGMAELDALGIECGRRVPSYYPIYTHRVHCSLAHYTTVKQCLMFVALRCRALPPPPTVEIMSFVSTAKHFVLHDIFYTAIINKIYYEFHGYLSSWYLKVGTRRTHTHTHKLYQWHLQTVISGVFSWTPFPANTAIFYTRYMLWLRPWERCLAVGQE